MCDARFRNRSHATILAERSTFRRPAQVRERDPIDQRGWQQTFVYGSYLVNAKL